MKRILVNFVIALVGTLAQTGFAQSLLYISAMAAPGLPDQKLAAFTQAAENALGRLAFIAVLERSENRYVLYVQDQADIRPVLVSSRQIGDFTVGSIAALHMLRDGSVYCLSRSGIGGRTGIVMVTSEGVVKLVYSCDPSVTDKSGRRMIEILDYDVNQTGNLILLASNQSPGVAGSVDVFYVSAGQATPLLTPAMVSGSLPDCVGFKHPLITETGSVYTAAYRMGGRFGLQAPLAFVEWNFTGVHVLAREGQIAPSGEAYRSLVGGEGFKALAGTPDAVYFTANSSDQLELQRLTSSGIEKVEPTFFSKSGAKVSFLNAVPDGIGIVALGLVQQPAASPKRAILIGSDLHPLLSEGDQVGTHKIAQIFSFASNARRIYAVVRFEDTNGSEGILQFAR